MRFPLRLSLLSLVAAAVAVVASCRTPVGESLVKDDERDRREDAPAPAEAQAAQQAPTDPETVAAIQALRVIGADTPFHEGPKRCAGVCHDGTPTAWHTSVHIDLVKKWGKQMQDIDACMKTQTLDKRKLRCFRTAMNDTAPWDKSKMGFWRAAGKTAEITSMFKKAYGNSAGPQRQKEFVKETLMPKETSPDTMPDADFQKLKAWVLGGMKKIDEAFGGGGAIGEVACTDEVSNELIDHIRKMKTEGWGWKNVNNEQISMFGCPTVEGEYDELSTPLNCFMDDAKWPLAHQKDYAKGWAEKYTATGVAITQRIRILKELPYQSTYWARSSADGRFTASGLRGGPPPGGPLPEDSQGYIVDLKDQSRQHIGVTGPYDPGFFPDNKGFTFMGGGAYFCSQSLIEDPNTRFIDFDNETTFCGKGDMGVYQHVGAVITGGDYFVVRSDNYSNDDGAYSEVRDPSPQTFAVPDAELEIFPMKESGTSFAVQPVVKIMTPMEGDWGIFPSAQFLTSRVAERVGASAVQKGYRVNKFDLASKTIKPVATICMKGGKASLSFNERIMTTHHYTDESDFKDLKLDRNSPEFRGLIETSSNIWIYDMFTKRKMRITKMKAGQFALYPHFRADGWLYFLVRDTNSKKDYMVATDAAIRMQK